MNTLTKLTIATFVLIAVVLAVGFWPHKDSIDQPVTTEWTCSMHPQIRQTQPRASALFAAWTWFLFRRRPKEKEQIEARAGVLTEPVTYRELFKEIRTVGKLDYNERAGRHTSPRGSPAGWTASMPTSRASTSRRTTHLADIYSPDLYVAQSELIRAARTADAPSKKPGASIQDSPEPRWNPPGVKLRLLGILPEQTQADRRSRRIQSHLTIYAPIGGTVIEKNVRAGQYVKEGDVLYRIADLDPIWLFLDLYEYDLGWVSVGQKVDVPSKPTRAATFPGTVRSSIHSWKTKRHRKGPRQSAESPEKTQAGDVRLGLHSREVAVRRHPGT